nr:DUF302 domain-containing protein [uncultured Mucilaginibacter sp.]
MKANNISFTRAVNFETALVSIRETIVKNGFIILYEIDPQKILADYGIETLKIRQVLFFHPDHMKELLDNDATAIIEAPLKFVIKEIDEAHVEVTTFDIKNHFSGYEGLETLSTKLEGKMQQIIGRILNFSNC